VKNEFTKNLIQEITAAKKGPNAQTAEGIIPMKQEFLQLFNSTKMISSIISNIIFFLINKNLNSL
jgi:hypothetical protein